MRSSSLGRAGESPKLRILCIVPFLNEAEHLPTFLDSLRLQRRPPECVVLVDDGSSDCSPQLAARFAQGNPRVAFLRRPRRPDRRDRLAEAAELVAFTWALERVSEPWDVVGKLDADLRLGPDLLGTIEQAFLQTPELGVAGSYLSTTDPKTGGLKREPCDPRHVRGATKFYRRACYEQIAPIEPFLGWDTIDEVSARARGWRTLSLSCPEGDPIHLRPTGSVNGLVRAQYRWGMCAYGIGQHPLWVLLSGVRRFSARPRPLGSLAFLAGWAAAALRGRRRAAPALRAYVRREQLKLLRQKAQAALRI